MLKIDSVANLYYIEKSFHCINFILAKIIFHHWLKADQSRMNILSLLMFIDCKIGKKVVHTFWSNGLFLGKIKLTNLRKQLSLKL